jgi:transposase
MFFRQKRSGSRTYLQIVENVRAGGQVRQHVIATLGRMDDLARSGRLEALLASGARFSDQVMLLSQAHDTALTARRIGPPLVFGRLWEETGIKAVLDALLPERSFGFPVERAIFTTTLHRILISGSDRACEFWRDDYLIPGAQDLQLHHFYRAMAWLGEPLGPEHQDAATPGAPRCTKDLIEEQLFARRRDLFSELSLCFFDTTSLYFEGDGGATLGRRGHSKDYRPQLNQMILGVVLDDAGRPICSQMWPGNTADVTTLIPVVDRLARRFGITRVCVVADRGMISRATLEALEQRRLEYILGVRERSTKEVRDHVLEDDGPSLPIVIERAGGRETELEAKEVRIAGRRYIVCRNEAQAKEDAATREAVLATLRDKLRQGDKSLVGNTAYRRFLKAPAGDHFEIDAAKVAEEARYDGVFVLRTNTRLSPLAVMLQYRRLLQVEQVFRAAKAVIETRPIYHRTDAAIRGHVFCSFLAIVLEQALMAHCAAQGLKPERQPLLLDLDRLQETVLAHKDKTWIVRTEASGCTAAVFRALGLALPPRTRPLDPNSTPAAAL